MIDLYFPRDYPRAGNSLQMNFIQFTRSTCIACVIEHPEHRLNYRCNVSTEVILTTCLTHRARMHFVHAQPVY